MCFMEMGEINIDWLTNHLVVFYSENGGAVLHCILSAENMFKRGKKKKKCSREMKTHRRFFHINLVLVNISCQTKVTNFCYISISDEDISCGKVSMNYLPKM